MEETIYDRLLIAAMREVIRNNRKPDKSLTAKTPDLQILDGNGQVTPHYIALQAKQIADEVYRNCYDNNFDLAKKPA